MTQITVGMILFTMAAGFCLIYSAYEFTNFMKNRNLISYTTATITDITTVVPETMKTTNSKLASVSFDVDGKGYTSSNRVQVSMNSSIGDKIKIAYYKDNPKQLFTSTMKKANIFFIIGVFCIAIMLYIKINI